MRWPVRRWVSRVLLGLAALTVVGTMGIVIDEDDVGGSLFLVGVVLFVAATVLHCRRPPRLVPLVACYGVGSALIPIVILVAVTLGPDRGAEHAHWGWRDAALGIGMACLMSLATLIWCLGTDPVGRAACWAAIPLIAGVATSSVPFAVVHDRAVAVSMAAALLGAVLCEVFPAPELTSPAAAPAGTSGG